MTKIRITNAKITINVEMDLTIDRTIFERKKKELIKELTAQYGFIDDVTGKPFPGDHHRQPDINFTYKEVEI